MAYLNELKTVRIQSAKVSSYLSQVCRLRNLAKFALLRYSIEVESMHFIHHGENTTFRVIDTCGRKYLLRIHRERYHTKSAIEEELYWLTLLSRDGMLVPSPVKSKKGEWVESVASDHLPARYCSLFKWVNGRFLGKGVKPAHLYYLGELIAELQRNVPRSGVIHRPQWTAEGLVGSQPKFGSIDMLTGVRPQDQALITKAREKVLRELLKFEEKFPERQGLIHADLHFGNILLVQNRVGAIDFDDCGFGFHVYDLVIPYLSVEATVPEKKRDRLGEYKDALISGYTMKKSWDHEDDAIFPYLVTARKLTMLGWLNSRSENPRIKKHLEGSVTRTLEHLKRLL